MNQTKRSQTKTSITNSHHVLSALFWDIMQCRVWNITQCRVVIPYQRLGTTYGSQLEGSRNPKQRHSTTEVNWHNHLWYKHFFFRTLSIL